MSTQTFDVTGMTCEHCVLAVDDELRSLDGVTGVEIALAPEGMTRVTVVGDEPLTDQQVAAALDEAGDYRLAGSTSP
ncbi:heavy-metal-associated domain-containing protein [uncultured Jatrophihabitans sp.]|uniref:heavy-metal-associated domain-containing protein n=1 Tax=uncultured Jatrophihabitans sp. TaxID=1610747 RepID=UPI0035CA5891